MSGVTSGGAALPDQPIADPQAWPPLLDAYLTYLATQRRVAASTLDAYRKDFVRLLSLSEGRPLEALCTADFRRMVARMHGAGLGVRSIARVLSCWRGYYRWQVRHHALPGNPLDGVRPPKGGSRLPRALSPDQTQALLESEQESALSVRDRAMFELFYSSGLRLSELAGLRAGGDVDFSEGMVTVHGKRGKARSVPVGAPALAALQAWLAQRSQFVREPTEALFLSRTGTPLGPSAIRNRLAQWARQSGLGVHVHPHMLRHSFASHVLQSSGDLRAVQELLGHDSIRSTQIYTHLDFQHLASVYDRAHPRARKP